MVAATIHRQIRVEILRDWLEQIARLINNANSVESEDELTAIQHILERSGRAAGVIGLVTLTQWINGSGGFLAHEGVSPFQDERIVTILDDRTDRLIHRIETLTGISAFSLALTGETLDVWASALSDLAETDGSGSTTNYPDGGRALSAKHALLELQQCALSYAHVVPDKREGRAPYKTVIESRGPVVVLRDRRTPQPSQYPHAVERELRDLVKNIERLTGIPAKYADDAECTLP